MGMPLTSWVDSINQHIVYLTYGGYVYEVYYPLGAGPWQGDDATAMANSAPAVPGSALTSWLDSTYQHVAYLTPDGHVHELHYALGSGPWTDNDLTAAAGAPATAAGSALASWVDNDQQHVVFLTAHGHVHNLYTQLGTGGWGKDDLTALTGAPAAAAGSALTSWAAFFQQHVVYLSADGHLHDLYIERLRGQGSWTDNDLTVSAGAPVAAAGSALTSWNANYQEHVAYLTGDGHVHELYYEPGLGQGPWSHCDLTGSTRAPAAAAGSPLTSWGDDTYQHVVYAGPQGRVYELYYGLAGGPWMHNDLSVSASAPAATAESALTSWEDSAYQHVAYVAKDGHLHELYYALGSGPWAQNDVTYQVGAPPPAP